MSNEQELTFTLIHATDMEWADPSHTVINYTARLEESDELIPTSVRADESEPHLAAIYERLTSGEFGAIQPCVALHLIFATDPRYVNSEHTAIDLSAKFAEIDEIIQFTATSYDTEAHGRLAFERANAGEFGAVAEFVPYIPTIEEQAVAVRQVRDYALDSTDWSQAQDVPEQTRIDFAEFRETLRDITQQDGFPQHIAWPAYPEGHAVKFPWPPQETTQ